MAFRLINKSSIYLLILDKFFSITHVIICQLKRMIRMSIHLFGMEMNPIQVNQE